MGPTPMSGRVQPVSPLVRVLVAGAALMPPLALLISPSVMLLVSAGIWEKIAPYLDSQILEPMGWSFALAMGFGVTLLHASLLAFTLFHLVTNDEIPKVLRGLFAATILVLPFVSVLVYCFVYVLPDRPAHCDPLSKAPR